MTTHSVTPCIDYYNCLSCLASALLFIFFLQDIRKRATRDMHGPGVESFHLPRDSQPRGPWRSGSPSVLYRSVQPHTDRSNRADAVPCKIPRGEFIYYHIIDLVKYMTTLKH